MREANVDLSLAKDSSGLKAVRNFSAMALREAQLATHNILEQPEYMDAIINKKMIGGENGDDSVINLLMSMKIIQQQLYEGKNSYTKETIISLVENILESVPNIVQSFA